MPVKLMTNRTRSAVCGRYLFLYANLWWGLGRDKWQLSGFTFRVGPPFAYPLRCDMYVVGIGERQMAVVWFHI